MAKRYVQSGRPVGLPTDEASSDSERRRRNREMVAGRAKRSKKQQKKLVSRDPRIADSKRARFESGRFEERRYEKAANKHEWPSGKGQAAIKRRVAREKLIRDSTMEHGPKWERPKPGVKVAVGSNGVVAGIGNPNRGAANSVQRVR